MLPLGAGEFRQVQAAVTKVRSNLLHHLEATNGK